MPFRSVRTETAARFLELQQYRRMLIANEIALPSPPEHAMLKGHFVVGLYAYIEFSMQQLIKSAVAHLNAINVSRRHVQPDLFAMLAEPEFMSAADSTGEKKWLRRHEIVTSSTHAAVCIMHDTVLSREIQNTRSSTMDLVFTLFSLRSAAVVDDRTRRFVNEIGERRNAVAHGRESASEVGGRYTAATLQDRLTAIEAQILHMIVSFEDAAEFKRFIKPTCRRFYP